MSSRQNIGVLDATHTGRNPAGGDRNPAGGEVPAQDDCPRQAMVAQTSLRIPIASLLPADSPRLGGESQAHIIRLAETEEQLPPILVHRSTMRVIDGMHRLGAARLKGCHDVDVVFFDGSEQEAFVRCVEINIRHGLPLALSDRKAAATRIMTWCPELSDRSIASKTGLAAKTVARLRGCPTGDDPQSDGRLGMDGRIRPVDPTPGRRRAAEVIASHPGASVREIAAMAQVSRGTAQAVRQQILLGQPLVREEYGAAGQSTRPDHSRPDHSRRRTTQIAAGSTGNALSTDHIAIFERLSKDPSLRLTESGRHLLSWLRARLTRWDDWTCVVGAVPPHQTAAIADLASKNAVIWNEISRQLKQGEQARHDSTPSRRESRVNG